MKGVVFIAFNELVEEKMGIEVWEKLLAATNPVSGGVYISVEEYDDAELFDMVGKLSEISKVPVEVLVKTFGEYLFGILAVKYPMFVEEEKEFFGFLKGIEDTIHKEVRKLYENPNLPTMHWKQEQENTLDLYYKSPRKLCILAEGLIEGAAQYYKVGYTLDHAQCQHKGSDECLFRITLNG